MCNPCSRGNAVWTGKGSTILYMPFYVFFMHNIFNNCHYYSTQVSVLLIIRTRSWWFLVVGILITLIVLFVYNTLRQSHRPRADWNVMDSVSTHKIGTSQSIRWGTWLSLRKTGTSIFHMRIFFCKYTPFCPQANTRGLAGRFHEGLAQSFKCCTVCLWEYTGTLSYIGVPALLLPGVYNFCLSTPVLHRGLFQKSSGGNHLIPVSLGLP